MKQVTITTAQKEANKVGKAFGVKLERGLKKEIGVVEYFTSLVPDMDGKTKLELKAIHKYITDLQKKYKDSTMPSTLKTICNKLIKGVKLPDDYKMLTLSAVKNSMADKKDTVNEDKKEEIKVEGVKGLNKEDLLNEANKQFSFIKQRFDTQLHKLNNKDIESVISALKLMNDA